MEEPTPEPTPEKKPRKPRGPNKPKDCKKDFDIKKASAALKERVFNAMAESAMKPGIAGQKDRESILKYAEAASEDYVIELKFTEITQGDNGKVIVIDPPPVAPEPIKTEEPKKPDTDKPTGYRLEN